MERYYRNQKKGTRLHFVKACGWGAKGHPSSLCWGLNTCSKVKTNCMFPSHQDIATSLAKVLKQHVLTVALGGEEIFWELESHTGSYKEDPFSSFLLSFLSYISLQLQLWFPCLCDSSADVFTWWLTVGSHASCSISGVTQWANIFAQMSIPCSQASQSFIHGAEAKHFSWYEQCVPSAIVVIMWTKPLLFTKHS